MPSTPKPVLSGTTLVLERRREENREGGGKGDGSLGGRGIRTVPKGVQMTQA